MTDKHPAHPPKHKAAPVVSHEQVISTKLVAEAKQEDKQTQLETKRELNGQGQLLTQAEISIHELNKTYDIANNPGNAEKAIRYNLWDEDAARATNEQKLYTADMLALKLNSHNDGKEIKVTDSKLVGASNVVGQVERENTPAFAQYDVTLKKIADLPPTIGQPLPPIDGRQEIAAYNKLSVTEQHRKDIRDVNAYTKEVLDEQRGNGQVLDRNEQGTYELGKKLGLLKQPEQVVGRPFSNDPALMQDVGMLRRGLNNDGKHTDATQFLTNADVAAYKTMVYENAPAIMKYEQELQKTQPAPAHAFSGIDLGKYGTIGFKGAETMTDLGAKEVATAAPKTVAPTKEVMATKLEAKKESTPGS